MSRSTLRFSFSNSLGSVAIVALFFTLFVLFPDALEVVVREVGGATEVEGDDHDVEIDGMVDEAGGKVDTVIDGVRTLIVLVAAEYDGVGPKGKGKNGVAAEFKGPEFATVPLGWKTKLLDERETIPACPATMSVSSGVELWTG